MLSSSVGLFYARFAYAPVRTRYGCKSHDDRRYSVLLADEDAQVKNCGVGLGFSDDNALDSHHDDDDVAQSRFVSAGSGRVVRNGRSNLFVTAIRLRVKRYRIVGIATFVRNKNVQLATYSTAALLTARSGRPENKRKGKTNSKVGRSRWRRSN